MLIDRVLEPAKLDPTVIKALDLRRSFGVVALDDRAVGERNPAVVVLSVKSKDAFLLALQRKMKREKKDQLMMIQQVLPLEWVVPIIVIQDGFN